MNLFQKSLARIEELSEKIENMNAFLEEIKVPEGHALRGGTFVTNTSGNDTYEITESVKSFGDHEIFMRGIELHSTKKPFNLSDFWAYHRMRLSDKKGIKI